MQKNDIENNIFQFTLKNFEIIKSENGELKVEVQIIRKDNGKSSTVPIKKNTFNLTNREKEVLAQLAEGKSNVEIAKALTVSVHTVKAHVASILNKLSVEDRVKAVVKAISENIIKKWLQN